MYAVNVKILCPLTLKRWVKSEDRRATFALSYVCLLSVCERTRLLGTACVQARGLLRRYSSFLSCGSQRCNSGSQTWWQRAVSHQPLHALFNTCRDHEWRSSPSLLGINSRRRSKGKGGACAACATHWPGENNGAAVDAGPGLEVLHANALYKGLCKTAWKVDGDSVKSTCTLPTCISMP